MRILILSTISNYEWAGTEQVWFDFAKFALGKNHEVMLAADTLVASSNHVQALRSEGLRVSRRKVGPSMRLYLWKERFFPDHREAIRFKPDVCLINAGSPLELSNCPFLKLFLDRLDCKKVFYCHFNSDRLPFPDREAVKKTLLSMDGMVFVSEMNRTLLEHQLACGFPNAVTILNGPRLSLDLPLPYPPFSGGVVCCANVGRLETYWKGQDLLVQTWGSTDFKECELKLELFGTGPDETYLRDLIMRSHLESSIRLAGYERDVVNIWRRKHLLLLPSRGEGTPLAAIEAMMCGRPTVATDVGGVGEIIEDGLTGFIASDPTADSFRKTLKRALANRGSWEEMGREAHLRAVQLSASNPPLQLMNYLYNSVAPGAVGSR